MTADKRRAKGEMLSNCAEKKKRNRRPDGRSMSYKEKYLHLDEVSWTDTFHRQSLIRYIFRNVRETFLVTGLVLGTINEVEPRTARTAFFNPLRSGGGPRSPDDRTGILLILLISDEDFIVTRGEENCFVTYTKIRDPSLFYDLLLIFI